MKGMRAIWYKCFKFGKFQMKRNGTNTDPWGTPYIIWSTKTHF